MTAHSLALKPARAADPAETELTLKAVRAEIDSLDAELLRLVERRQRLAGRIGKLKESKAPGLKLRPDREAEVLARMTAKASPESRRLADALWRELMSAGLSAQGQLQVVVWSGARRDVLAGARSRFGGAADYREAFSPEAALEAAAHDDTVAVLALDAEAAWWADLPARPDLWAFEGLGRRGAAEPTALALGKVPLDTLARGGVAYRVSHGGDSGVEGRRERVLAVGEGARLCVSRDAPGPLARDRGVIGCAAL